MELPEIVDFARNFSVMVRIHGPDPKGVKMRNHAFHQYNSGKTTLSASGMLLPRNLRNVCMSLDCENCGNGGGAMVVTVASVVEPFLTQKSKMADAQGVPELIPGAQIDVMVEGELGKGTNVKGSSDNLPQWFGARVVKLVDIPASSMAIQSLIEASAGSSEHSWEVGWSLASQIDNPQKVTEALLSQEKKDVSSSTDKLRTPMRQNTSNVNVMAMGVCRLAFLQVSTLVDEDLPEVITSSSNYRGDLLLSMGSPFGVLSPLHFFNSISQGSVSNCYPPMTLDSSLLMADIRCLPGMEGSPVFGEHACLIGILNRPLRQTGGAEIQVVIPWRVIEGACGVLNKSLTCNVDRVRYDGDCCEVRTTPSNCMNHRTSPIEMKMKHLNYCSPPLVVEQAMTSVCLITLDNGVWASGVVLNKQGLILTNAHLLEPWRFGRTTAETGYDKAKTKNLFTLFEQSISPGHAREEASEVSRSSALQPLDLAKGRWSPSFPQVHNRIRVRIDFMNSCVWCDAKVVYVSKGSLDISLLQLEDAPNQLRPIDVDLDCPSPGSKAFVVGHGLLGPRCDMLPSISSGVVVKVVKAKKMPFPSGEVPVMLETSAAVHPGSSGGAVVNPSGKMIGLVTSNAKHGGGTIIPHMNFSLPSAALKPVFDFAKDMQNISVLQELELPDKDLASAWEMVPPISPEQGPLPPDLNDLLVKDTENQIKGSQFASFMKERHELLRRSRVVNIPKDLPLHTIPSKL